MDFPSSGTQFIGSISPKLIFHWKHLGILEHSVVSFPSNSGSGHHQAGHWIWVLKEIGLSLDVRRWAENHAAVFKISTMICLQRRRVNVKTDILFGSGDIFVIRVSNGLFLVVFVTHVIIGRFRIKMNVLPNCSCASIHWRSCPKHVIEE